MKYVEEANRFVVFEDSGQEIGEITWSNAGETMIIIDHTYVDDAHRGRGIAEKLVALGVDYARKNNKKVMPLCPFAKKEFDQKKEYQDVLK
ncbi:MAG: GNAT family N-acetyltransferase [Vagococcus sp.]|uniref:GNAT family N-acetyltransferase n=1 Tax=Vagococcus sp. TaxID=1933889 RepID=UPI002FC93CD3